MSRIRTIKPSFFTSDTIASISPLARLLFVGLLTEADRLGRIANKPRQIKVKLLPYDTVEIDELLVEISGANLATLYESEGVKVIQINNFLEHQRPHPKEPASSLPEPCKKVSGREKKLLDNTQPVGREGKESLDKESREGVSVAVSFPGCLSAPEFEPVWSEWIQYKRERGEGYKATGLRNTLAELEKRGLTTAVKALRFSMAKGWKGPAEDGWMLNGNGKGHAMPDLSRGQPVSDDLEPFRLYLLGLLEQDGSDHAMATARELRAAESKPEVFAATLAKHGLVYRDDRLQHARATGKAQESGIH